MYYNSYIYNDLVSYNDNYKIDFVQSELSFSLNANASNNYNIWYNIPGDAIIIGYAISFNSYSAWFSTNCQKINNTSLVLGIHNNYNETLSDYLKINIGYIYK